jgi:hypothetical protein
LFLSVTSVWMNAFGISTIATSLSSIVLIIEVSITDSVSTVGELASSWLKYPLCLFPPATVLPLISPDFFCLMKIWDSRIFYFFSEDRLVYSFGMKEFRQWSCFILALAEFVASFTQVLIAAFSNSWVKIVLITLGSYSDVLSLTWVAAYFYDILFLLGVYNFTFDWFLDDCLGEFFDSWLMGA